MSIKAVLFDLDGTLIDSEQLWIKSYVEMLISLGIAMDYETAKFQLYGRSSKDLYEFTLGQHEHFPYNEKKMEESMRSAFVKLREKQDIIIHSSLNKLKQLSKHYYIAIVSGSPKPDIYSALTLMNIKEDIQFIVSSEDCVKGKPDPEGYLKAMTQGHFKAEECLVFEDSLAGVKAAKAAGMFCVALKTYNHFNEDLSLADQVVTDLNLVDVNDFPLAN